MLSEPTVFHNLLYPILVVNRSCEVILCNDAVSQFWQRDKLRVLHKPLKKFFPPNGTVITNLPKVFEEGKNFTISDHSLNISPTQEKVVNISMNPIYSPDRKINHAVILVHDHTHHYHIREKEQEMAILDSIGTFVSSVAHEIQNPLSGIKGATQLLQRDLESAAMSTASTQMILKELNRIDRLVKELLLHSQPMPLEYSTFNLHELLNTVIWFEENSSNLPVRFHRYFDPSLPEIVADRDKLHQVFLNLIINAVEASPMDGDIFIRTNYCPKWQVAGKKLNVNQEYYLIEFEDRGSGVSPEFVEQLFKPLFTTKRKGTGLGLSISFRIISAHQGLLEYHPSARQGSVFKIYLPQSPLTP